MSDVQFLKARRHKRLVARRHSNCAGVPEVAEAAGIRARVARTAGSANHLLQARPRDPPSLESEQC
eukprot:9426341-Pyramimonas_sp.AAC.2